jgi:parallel beta-helix repeat protein
VANTEASNNEGSTGIWFDASCYNMTIVNNVTTNNGKDQIEVEVSDKGIIANNVATGGESGIVLFDAGNFKVFNNKVGGSKLFGIQLSQDHRRQSDASIAEEHDPRRPIPDPTVPWLVKNITLSNNVFGNGGYFQFYALDKKTHIPVDKMNVTITGNLFNKRVSKSTPTMVAWGKGDNVTLERYETPAALAAAKGSSWRNAQTSSSLSISSMSTDINNHAGIAVGLPSDVAAAIGTSAGTKALGTL